LLQYCPSNAPSTKNAGDFNMATCYEALASFGTTEALITKVHWFAAFSCIPAFLRDLLLRQGKVAVTQAQPKPGFQSVKAKVERGGAPSSDWLAAFSCVPAFLRNLFPVSPGYFSAGFCK